MSRVIEWRHDGRRLIIPLIIQAPEPLFSVDGYNGIALVDTGATISAVTPRVVRTLQLPQLGKRPLASAQGEGQAERYLFRFALQANRVHAPSFPFVFEEVVGFELTDSFQFDALIGMDILSQCDFEMLRNGICRLTFG